MKSMAEQIPARDKRLKLSWAKIVIILLSVLLAISAGGLAVQYAFHQFRKPSQTTVTVPDNLIAVQGNTDAALSPAPETVLTPGEQAGSSSGSGGAETENALLNREAAVLELYQGKPDDNQQFQAANLLPGDSVTRYFCVKAHHDQDITLYFRTEVTQQTKNLGDVLHIRVTHLDTGKVLCDAPFSEVDKQEFPEQMEANDQGQSTAYYQVDVWTDTSVGNEYQAAGLTADFHWYVQDEGDLNPPETGDPVNLTLWAVLALSSAGLTLLLLVRRKEEKRHVQAE